MDEPFSEGMHHTEEGFEMIMVVVLLVNGSAARETCSSQVLASQEQKHLDAKARTIQQASGLCTEFFEIPSC